MYYAIHIDNETQNPGAVIAWSPINEQACYEAAETVARAMNAETGERVDVRITTISWTKSGINGIEVSSFTVEPDGVVS